MTKILLLGTAEAPTIRRAAGFIPAVRRRTRGLIPFTFLGACAVALGGCASSGLAQASKDGPPAVQPADGVQQAQAVQPAPSDPNLRPVPKQDPSEPSFLKRLRPVGRAQAAAAAGGQLRRAA